jgi:hypothetical protein
VVFTQASREEQSTVVWPQEQVQGINTRLLVDADLREMLMMKETSQLHISKSPNI